MTMKASLRRLSMETKWLEECPYFNAKHSDNDFSNWTATIPGPSDSPYENGHFKLEIKLPDSYPFSPPKVKMMTKVFHPNIRDESICIDILQSNWTSALNIQKILLSLSSLLTDPNPSSPLNEEAAQLYTSDREKYNATVRKWVKDYASLE